jgi:hypothetical protein
MDRQLGDAPWTPIIELCESCTLPRVEESRRSPHDPHGNPSRRDFLSRVTGGAPRFAGIGLFDRLGAVYASQPGSPANLGAAPLEQSPVDDFRQVETKPNDVS